MKHTPSLSPDPRRGEQWVCILTASKGSKIIRIDYDPARYASPGEQAISENPRLFQRPGFEPVASETVTRKMVHPRRLHVDMTRLERGEVVA